MKSLFILNPTNNSTSVSIQSGDTSILTNAGPDGAVNVNGGNVTMCYAPKVDIPQEPTSGGDIEVDGLFMVQVNGNVIPFYFTPEQLGEYFNKENSYGAGIAFVVPTAPPFNISCVGATNAAITGGVWGEWQVEINGVLTIVDDVAFTDKITLENYRETAWGWTNKTNEDLRVRLFNGRDINPNDGGWEENTNPTVNFTDSEITFCLAANGNRYHIQCTPVNHQTEVILNKSRDTLPFLTFRNVAFDIYEDGVLKFSNGSLLDPTVELLTNLNIEDLDGNGRHIRITNTSDVSVAVELLSTDSNMPYDTDVEVGVVEVIDNSFHFCLAAVGPS